MEAAEPQEAARGIAVAGVVVVVVSAIVDHSRNLRKERFAQAVEAVVVAESPIADYTQEPEAPGHETAVDVGRQPKTQNNRAESVEVVVVLVAKAVDGGYKLLEERMDSCSFYKPFLVLKSKRNTTKIQ